MKIARCLGTPVALAVVMVLSTGCQPGDGLAEESAPSTLATTTVVAPGINANNELGATFTSETSLGTIDWSYARGYPYGAAYVFRLDGTLYVNHRQSWWTSADGIVWSELGSPPNAIPEEFIAEGADAEFYEVDGVTWVTLKSDDEVKILSRHDGEWLELKDPLTAPPPPPGFAELRHQGVRVLTDFGWMKMTFGGSLSVFNPNDLILYISPDGEHWEGVEGMPRSSYSSMLPIPLPFIYQAGLFIRELPGSSALIGRLQE